MKFGRWNVIDRADDYVDEKGRHNIRWNCWCDCQKDIPFDERTIRKVMRSGLTSGISKSCGCLGKEHRAEAVTEYFSKNRSTYNLTNEYGVGYTYDCNIFYFDLEDYDKIKDYNWFVNDQGYLLARVTSNKTKCGFTYIRMHRLIMDVDNKYEVDHIHGKITRNDNRKSNLRIATHSQNNINKDKTNLNTSGYKGIDFYKRLGKWRARIHVNKKMILLGYFDKLEDAVNIRKEAEKKYHGEWDYNYSQNIKEYEDE